jgi:hypothetical protein
MKEGTLGDPFKVDATPKPRVHLEKIGGTEWELREDSLDVFDDVTLWPDNPRLLTFLPSEGFASEEELEAALRQTRGYDGLRKSIEDLGQMEAAYVWRQDDKSKFIVLEGATRLSILRELRRKHERGPLGYRYQRMKVKVLPPHFGLVERAILLARIHVRGTGVRAWGRYIEAKFIYENVVGDDRHPPLMSVTEMARHMEKSVSWVQRLRDAYQFARRFVEHVDNDQAEHIAVQEFSTLEEISKAPGIGARLRDYENKEADGLRTEVFEMVRNEAFKEYRDARFLKDFHDDPDKWAQLKSGQRHIASRLAAEVKTVATSVKTKIASLEQQIQRGLERQEADLNEDDIESLERAISRIEEHIHQGVRPFRIALKKVARALSSATLSDIKSLQAEDMAEFTEALSYFHMLVERHGKAA